MRFISVYLCFNKLQLTILLFKNNELDMDMVSLAAKKKKKYLTETESNIIFCCR